MKPSPEFAPWMRRLASVGRARVPFPQSALLHHHVCTAAQNKHTSRRLEREPFTAAEESGTAAYNLWKVTASVFYTFTDIQWGGMECFSHCG